MANTASAYRRHLPPGHLEREYRFESILGEGGFGVTYLASDTRIGRRVAIKEFLPAEFAMRDADLTVRPKSETERTLFEWGRRRFLEEARLLARFDHPNIVQVQRYFEANGTAYMVMTYVEGRSLFDVIEHQGTLGERALRDILYPLLDGLEAIHAANFLHRDIKPENIFIGLDGSPVLLDFGAARQAIEGRSGPVTRIVTPGYAPPEQYEAGGGQGPWSDIYALAGVLYTGVTGRMPVDAPARINAVMAGRPDPLVPAARTGGKRYSKGFLRAIDRGLALRTEDRPHSVARWESEFRTGKIGDSASSGKTPDKGVTPTGLPQADTGARRISRTGFLAATMAVFLAWAALPLATRAIPLQIGDFAAGSALYAAVVGLILGLALKFLVPGLSWVALPVIGAGWGLGLLAQTALRLFAPELASVVGWQVTQVYFAAAAVAGLTGGSAVALGARLAPSPMAWWAGALSAVIWGVAWWLTPYLFFSARVQLAGRIESVGFAMIDAVLTGLAALAGFFAVLGLWQRRRLPRWRQASASVG